MLATVTVVSLSSFREHQALSNSVDDVLLRSSARLRAGTIAAEGGTSYGVHFDANDAVLFAGSTYSSGALGNVAITLDPAIEIDAASLSGGGSDVVFDPLTGGTSTDGTLVIKRVSTATGERTLTISETGEVSSD